MRLAMNLARFPVEDVQYAAYRMDGFDRELIERYLEPLRPDNLLRLYSAPDVEADQTSPWFHTPGRTSRHSAHSPPSRWPGCPCRPQPLHCRRPDAACRTGRATRPTGRSARLRALAHGR
ncbi:hypothetical protein [Halomonas sp. E19]|uniref:hypothetical protein n=1 Tax=Halomonas sp. E19 TaxID=3397247 RepID=UPI00403494AE